MPARHAGAQYWNADREWVAPPAAFVDAIHLRWSAVQDFSMALAEQLRREAHDALAPFGDNAQRLRELADLIVQRKA